MTARTNAEITTSLADNAPNRAITESRMRDLWDSTVAKTKRSVKQHGALGNGSANDTAAIQACVDEVAAAGGGYVFVPAGTYMINAGIRIKAGVTIEGEFGGSAIAAMNPISAGMLFTQGTDALTGVRNLCLNGRRALMGGDLTTIALHVNHSATPNTAFGTASIFAGEIDRPYSVFENIQIAGIAGYAVKYTGTKSIFRGIDAVGVNKAAFWITGNEGIFDHCGQNGAREEAFIVAGTDNQFISCKASFAGTGGNTAFGDYTSGVGFNITGADNMFAGCEGMDTDGPAFWIRASRNHLNACFSTQGSNLRGTSANIGQSPLRGGGWTGAKVGFLVDNSADYCVINGHAKDKLVGTVNEPNLAAAVQVNAGCIGNLINVGGDPGILNTPGTTPWVLNNGTSTTIVHNYNG